MTIEEFRSIGFALGPTKTLVKLFHIVKNNKLRSFSSYKTVKGLTELLWKFKVKITDIKQFNPGMENFLFITCYCGLMAVPSPLTPASRSSQF